MRALLKFSLFVALAACGNATSASDGGPTGADMAMACGPATYPCGPYGTAQGSVIANLTLPVQSGSGGAVISATDPVQMRALSTYYQDHNIKALFLGVAAFWCQPCKVEQPDLVALYNSYGGSGAKVAFLEAIIQKTDMSPAQTADVDAWAQAYSIPFDMASDPTAVLAPYYNPNTFPMQMVISTKDMKITWQKNGATQSDRMAAIDAVVNAH